MKRRARGESKTRRLSRAAVGAGLNGPAAHADRFAGAAIHQFDKFIVGAVAYAIVIRIAGDAVGRIGEDFVEEDCAAGIAEEIHRYRIAVAAVAVYRQVDGAGAAQVGRHAHVNFIEAGHRRRRHQSFGVHHPSANRDGGDRRVARAGAEDTQMKIAAGGIEWPFLKCVRV